VEINTIVIFSKGPINLPCLRGTFLGIADTFDPGACRGKAAEPDRGNRGSRCSTIGAKPIALSAKGSSRLKASSCRQLSSALAIVSQKSYPSEVQASFLLSANAAERSTVTSSSRSIDGA
jgi:hypothetical protein